ncbi:MAG: aspartate-semialdehyde dehydrogenase [Acidobacteriota bacterium]|nr:aspartate-semialdehyde dehydrogenase [Acidobacteriota bacterium]
MAEKEQKIPVAVLGATGLVGQRLVTLLVEHPWFEIAEVAASERSAGKPYEQAVRWRLPGPPPGRVASMTVLPAHPDHVASKVVFSALDARAAESAEALFAQAGRAVISNARTHRMAAPVPLLIPEVNPSHLALLDNPSGGRREGGFIVTNPNCSTIALTLALAPFAQHCGIEEVVVTTLQAISGAGYPGVAALDMVDNVVPWISGEEEKIQREPLKILGRLQAGRIEPAAMRISAQVHRVPVCDGHLLTVHLRPGRDLSPEQATALIAGFQGEPQRRRLPSAPARPLEIVHGRDRPQPRLDRDAGAGMSVTVGQIRRCSVLGLKMEILGHNTVRGAAGGTLLIAELLADRGLLP